MALSKNKSDVYGGYGGVSRQNHYIPPQSPPFDPQPATVHITENQLQEIIEKISTISFQEATTFVAENSGSIVLRNVLIDRGGYKTSVLFSQDNLSDLLTVTSKATSTFLPVNNNPSLDLTKDTILTENIFLTQNTMLTANKNYFVECTQTPLTLTLPAVSQHGDFVNINFKKEIFNLTIESKNYLIKPNERIITIANTQIFGLLFDSLTQKWEYISNSGFVSDLTIMDGGTF